MPFERAAAGTQRRLRGMTHERDGGRNLGAHTASSDVTMKVEARWRTTLNGGKNPCFS
jgi:hypothetical protein